MRVLTVNGEQLTDMIVWLWEADDDTVELEVFDPRDGTVTPVELDRFPGEALGFGVRWSHLRWACAPA